MNTEMQAFDLFGLPASLTLHESSAHPAWQLMLPCPGWQLVVQRRDLYADLADAQEPRAAWFGPRTYAEVLQTGMSVELASISFPPELNRGIARYVHGCASASACVSDATFEMDSKSPLQSILAPESISLSKLKAEVTRLLGPFAKHEALFSDRPCSERTRRYRHAAQLGYSQRQRRQIERAVKVIADIATTKTPLGVVAQDHGFSDQPHLNRSLRRWLRAPLSPSELRKAVAGSRALYLDLADCRNVQEFASTRRSNS